MADMPSDTPIFWPHDSVIHAYWIESGLILAGEHPGDDSSSKAKSKLAALLDHGILTFIDLTHPADRLPAYVDRAKALARLRACGSRPIDIAHISHPIRPGGVLPIEAYDTILDDIDDAAAKGPVFIHGKDGLGRTATVVGCYLVKGGLSFEGAMRTIKERRAGTRKADMRAPESHVQRDIISRYVDRMRERQRPERQRPE